MKVDDALESLAGLVEVRLPASVAELRSAEARLGYPIPVELKAFYLRANGTVDATPVENGWTRLWSVHEWQAVTMLGFGSLYLDIEDAAVVADYSLESWWYAVNRSGVVYIVDGARPARVVAQTFSEFVTMLLRDQADLYPSAEDTSQQREAGDRRR